MLPFIQSANLIFLTILAASYLYQLIYALVGLFNKRLFAEPEARQEHKFAVVVAARNEENVIAGLLGSLRRQNYPSDQLDLFVVADNCTDDTARRAAEAGATVYRRWNPDEVGKGYALNFLFRRILQDHGDAGYEGYFIFDADNLVDPNFVAEMNKTYDRGGYDAITGYRNSRNFGDNWISAGYSIWFLRQARFMNFPRSLLRVGCSVGGTGFFVSDRLVRENGGWPFHLLTEDIEFTADCAVRGRTIGYCDRAVVFDEQPTAFGQSWDQRLRWSKGFYQVDARYGLPLVRGILQGGHQGFTCYDTFMAIAPGVFFALLAAALNVSAVLFYLGQPAYLAVPVLHAIAHFIVLLCLGYYVGMFLLAFLTVASEWRRIPAGPWEKLKYLFSFPLFMLTYLPVAITALFRKVEWKPIRHTPEAEMEAKRV